MSVKAVHDVTNTVNLSDGEELLYTVRKKKQIVSELQEKQKKMISAYSGHRSTGRDELLDWIEKCFVDG